MLYAPPARVLLLNNRYYLRHLLERRLREALQRLLHPSILSALRTTSRKHEIPERLAIVLMLKGFKVHSPSIIAKCGQ